MSRGNDKPLLSPEQMIPPPEMNFVGGGDFRGVGEAYLKQFIKFGLKPHHKVLDVGCGIGRMAIPLTGYLNSKGSYDGFDIREDGIRWCSEKISPSFPRFRFKLATLRNSLYLPEDQGDPARFIFPYPSRSFDFVILTSVFTHLGDAVVCRYLDEINRVLRRDGKMVATFFLFGHNSRDRKDRVAQNLTFAHHFGHYRLLLSDNPDAATAFDESWAVAQCERRGLQVKWPVRHGFQDIVVATKKRSLPFRTRWREFRRRIGLE
jgi:SAM-dependent methyltransferase